MVKSVILWIMVYVAFFLLAALVVFLSMKLGKYVDLLDKTTNVSGAFIGGVLLAAVTSLPELFTSLSATLILKQNQLVLGNILGSNLFNLAVLAVIVTLFFKRFKGSKVGKNHLLTMVGCFVIYALVAVAVYVTGMPKLGYLNLISPIILVVYLLVLLKTPKTEEPEEKVECALTTKQIVARFITAAVVLIGASVCITFATDYIAEALNLGKTLAGALFLGLTTSLPELVSTASLCRRGNFNAATGNIFGSNLFNFTILALADALSFQKGTSSVYIPFFDAAAGTQAVLMLWLGIAASVFMFFVLLSKIYTKPQSRLLCASVIPLNTLTVVSYVLFLVLSVTLV